MVKGSNGNAGLRFLALNGRFVLHRYPVLRCLAARRQKGAATARDIFLLLVLLIDCFHRHVRWNTFLLQHVGVAIF